MYMYSEFFYLQKNAVCQEQYVITEQNKTILLIPDIFFICDLKEATWYIQQLLILLFL